MFFFWTFFLKKIDLSLFSTSFFTKYLRVVEDGPERGYLYHTDTFLLSSSYVFILHAKHKRVKTERNQNKSHSNLLFD